MFMKKIFKAFLFFITFSSLSLGLHAQRIQPWNLPVSAEPVWERQMDSTVLGLPFLQAESIVIVEDNGNVRSWGISGTHLWDFDPQGTVSPHSSRSMEGTTYVSNNAGRFMAVNRVGRELWHLDLGSPMSFPAVVGWDGRLFIFTGSDVYCRTAAGLSLWSQNLGSNIIMAPVLDNAGGIVTYLQNNEFIRISHLGTIERIPLTRQPAIIVPLLDPGVTPGPTSSGNSYLLLYQNGEAENISINFSAARGNQLSRRNLPTLPTQPVAAAGRDNLAAITLRDGRVILIDGVTGQVRWTENSHETTAERGTGNLNPGDVTMAFDDRGIFSLSRIGATSFTVDSRRRWIFRLPATSTVPVLSDEGFIYACGRDMVLRAYKIDNQRRNIPRSMYGPNPPGTYGLGNPPPTHWAGVSGQFEEGNIRMMHDEIAEIINSGQIGESEPYVVGYCMEIIGFFITRPNASLVRPLVRVPERIEFIRLLANIGSRETIPFLVNIYNRDPEPSIKAACTEAIGKIGVDPNGEAIMAYSFLLGRHNVNRDSQLLLSASDSIAALVRFSGPPLAADGILLLTQIARFPAFRSDVRQRAQDQLNALRLEGYDIPISY